MRKRTSRNISKCRSGLAPLELVLYLPIMLFVMALMVNFGNIAAWKVRTQGNTRYAGTRTLDDRTGQNEVNPNTWPRPATLSTSNGGPLNDVDTVWDQNPDLTTPVTRGPVIVENDQGRSIVVPGRFPMDETVHTGNGRVSRQLPLLRGLLANDGTYSFRHEQEFLDNRWEYRHLSHPSNPYDRRDVSGDSGNMRRRAKRWYRMDPEFFGEIASELQQLKDAHQRLLSNPSKADLDPLDRDFDFYSIRLARQIGGIASQIQPPVPDYITVSVPDFHPRARQLCTLDLLRMQRGSVDPLIDRIQRLPGRMAGSFISLYQGEIARLEAMMPPPQGEINRLQQLLDQVRRFQSSLPQKYQ